MKHCPLEEAQSLEKEKRNNRVLCSRYDLCPNEKWCAGRPRDATPGPLLPYEDEDGFAVVGPVHNPRGSQERYDHVDQARVHLVHLVKEKGRPSAVCQVPLDPALQVFLGKMPTAP